MSEETLSRGGLLQRLIVSLRTVELLALLLGGVTWMTVLVSVELAEILDWEALNDLLIWSSVLALVLMLPAAVAAVIARRFALRGASWDSLFETANELRACYFSTNSDATQRRWCIRGAIALTLGFAMVSIPVANSIFALTFL